MYVHLNKEEAWTHANICHQAIENDEIDYEEYVEQNYQAKAKRSARKVAGLQASEQSTPAPEFDIPQKKAGRGRGRGRPSGKNTPHEASPMPSKRKRAKEMSLTPSADDDDDDDDDKPSVSLSLCRP